MRIVHIIPGTADVFYCQNCLRDKELIMELRRLGHDVTLVPMYLPLFSEGEELGSADVPVFYGAVGVYLAQHFPLLNKAPRWLRSLLDSRRLLRWVSKKSGTTRASGLEAMTLSVLRGETGGQKEELDQLLVWLGTHAKPDIVHLSNALLLGLAGRLRRDLNVPIICTLQDEDSWINSMDPAWAASAWEIMAEKAADIAAFIPVSDYYSRLMQKHLAGVPAHRFHKIPIGIAPGQYRPAPSPPPTPVIGYLSKTTESLGLGLLINAFIQLKHTPALASLQLKIMGGETPDDRPFLRQMRKTLAAQGMLEDVEFFEGVTRERRLEFLQSLSLLSVPTSRPEAFGMFILEALACGVPVVQPRLGAFPEIIDATGGGLCYDPGKPDELPNTLEHLLLNPETARAMGRQGCGNIRRVFDVRQTARRVMDVYKQCLAPGLAILLASGLTGLAAATPPDTLSVGWRARTGAPVSQSPIVHNGSVYAVTDRGEMIALGMDGTKRWTAALPQPVRPPQDSFSTPPLGANNLLVAGTDQGYVYAFDGTTGRGQWKTKIGETIHGALSRLEPEGTNGFTVLALSRNDGRLHRLDLGTGRILWTSKPIGRSDCSPGVGKNFIVFGACDSALHFLSPASGLSIATLGYEAQGPLAGGVAIDRTQVFSGSRDGTVICAGTGPVVTLWTNQVADGEIFTTPAVTSNRVLVGSNDGALYLLDRATGQRLWKTPTAGNPTSPVIAGDKAVVSADGTLALIDLENGKILWSDTPCDLLSPPTVMDDKVIAGTDDGFIILYQKQ